MILEHLQWESYWRRTMSFSKALISETGCLHVHPPPTFHGGRMSCQWQLNKNIVGLEPLEQTTKADFLVRTVFFFLFKKTHQWRRKVFFFSGFFNYNSWTEQKTAIQHEVLSQPSEFFPVVHGVIYRMWAKNKSLTSKTLESVEKIIIII